MEYSFFLITIRYIHAIEMKYSKYNIFLSLSLAIKILIDFFVFNVLESWGVIEIKITKKIMTYIQPQILLFSIIIWSCFPSFSLNHLKFIDRINQNLKINVITIKIFRNLLFWIISMMPIYESFYQSKSQINISKSI